MHSNSCNTVIGLIVSFYYGFCNKFQQLCLDIKFPLKFKSYTVEPLIMNSPNSEKPLIIFPMYHCILFNRFVPLNKENLQIMKSTEVQTLGAYTVYLVYYANARALKLATPRVVAVVVLSVLAQTRASSISRHCFG